jgi:pimeloyl-ACP methyl ester carboxylesterase
MTALTHKRAKVNGVTLHYVTAGRGPTVLCGVIEECGHWVFEEKTDFICPQLSSFWEKHR